MTTDCANTQEQGSGNHSCGSQTRAGSERTGLCVSRGDAEGSLTVAHAFTAKGRASEYHPELTNFQRRCYSKVICVPSHPQTEGGEPQVSFEKLT